MKNLKLILKNREGCFRAPDYNLQWYDGENRTMRNAAGLRILILFIVFVCTIIFARAIRSNEIDCI